MSNIDPKSLVELILATAAKGAKIPVENLTQPSKDGVDIEAKQIAVQVCYYFKIHKSFIAKGFECSESNIYVLGKQGEKKLKGVADFKANVELIAGNIVSKTGTLEEIYAACNGVKFGKKSKAEKKTRKKGPRTTRPDKSEAPAPAPAASKPGKDGDTIASLLYALHRTTGADAEVLGKAFGKSPAEVTQLVGELVMGTNGSSGIAKIIDGILMEIGDTAAK